MIDLPDDVLRVIFQFIGKPDELNELKVVNKQFNQVIDKRCLTYWKDKPRYDLPNLKTVTVL